jgi:hypothetical protein
VDITVEFNSMNNCGIARKNDSSRSPDPWRYSEKSTKPSAYFFFEMASLQS